MAVPRVRIDDNDRIARLAELIRVQLHKKNLDFIVLNSLADQGAGFKHDTNKVTIIDSEGTKIDFPLKSKKDVANDIIDYLVSKIKMDV